MRYILTLVTALLLMPLLAPLAAHSDETLLRFAHLVRTETWTERWPNGSGEIETRTVTAAIWNDAIQAALDQANSVHLPKRDQPYYLDCPIIFKSGQKLTADADTEIRLKPGINTCMVRNENIIGFADKPVPEDTKPDTDITIEGGIWTTLATGVKDNNGNQRGYSSKKNPVLGTHGVILLHNVRNVIVRNVTVRQSKPFAIHLGNIRGFTVDGLTLDQHGRDGVHLDGPATSADFKALNEIVGKANKGDQKALAKLRKFLDENPQVWQRVGDLSRTAEHAWIALVAKGNSLAAEAMQRQLAQLKQELLGESTSVVDKMLSDTVIATWLELHYLRSVDADTRNRTVTQASLMVKRLESAQRRHHNALKQLTQIRKLLTDQNKLPPLRVFPYQEKRA